MTARDYLAAVQQRADAATALREVAGHLRTVDDLALAISRRGTLTGTEASIDMLLDSVRHLSAAVHVLRAVVDAALTPKENDS